MAASSYNQSFQEIKQSIARQQLAPIYILSGEEGYFIDELCDDFEKEVTRCINGLLALAGVDDEPSYSRSKIVNQLEETQMVMTAAAHLDDELILDKLPFVTQDDKEAYLERRNAGEMSRWVSGAGTNTTGEENGSEGGSGGSGEGEV